MFGLWTCRSEDTLLTEGPLRGPWDVANYKIGVKSARVIPIITLLTIIIITIKIMITFLTY